MKKTKRAPEPKATTKAAPPPRSLTWWPWAAAAAGLIVVFQVYGPALNGAFVLDDRALPFFDPHISPALSRWVGMLRPLLMLSYWLNYSFIGFVKPEEHPYIFHATNVLLHFFVSVIASLITAKLLEWADVTGRMRAALAVFSGALFLLHPLQTESVAYVASRSEDLSTLFYYGAFAVFLWRPTESITWIRSIAIMLLFAAALATKEHTLTLPALFLLTDYFWNRGGLRKNIILYGMFAAGAAVGGAYVYRVLSYTTSAGFLLKTFTPFQYFLTQCRVIWIYIRMFFLPFGQNIDPDIPISRGLFDQGAIFGLLALIALVAAAWIYRERYPLASYGIFVFLLLLSPTSSVVPIQDVLAEHRLYLPFIGLALVAVEFLRRLTFTNLVWASAAALLFCCALTYKRSYVWQSPLTLWQDSVTKSPDKYRPRFQLAYAQFSARRCPAAVQSYEVASRLAPIDETLLIDWGLALGCASRWQEALAKMQQARQFKNSAHIHTQIAMVDANLKHMDDALNELDEAEKIDPNFDPIYAYRGQVFAFQGNTAAAMSEFRRALALNPDNPDAQTGLMQLQQVRR
ncbi:MAG TPA: tetratricopeptide repeat protein [Bryobacteraceae bacterium]|nr:tetratricopeptide repeat protein [Bryobacteraceae bacterium]